MKEGIFYMEKLKMAVVGVGTIGAFHARVLNEADNAELCAVCDLNSELAKKAAKQYGCKCYTNIDDLAKDKEIKAVIICVPDNFHCETAEKLAKAGKHILIEKPIAKTVAEASRIEKACRESGVRLMVAHTTAFLPHIKIAKEKYSAGEIGEAVQLDFKHQSTWQVGEFLKGRDSMMFYIGVHDIYSIQLITGRRIIKVYSQKVQKISKYSEDCIITLFEMDNGAIGTLNVSWDLPSSYPVDCFSFVINGTKGMLVNDNHTAGIKVFNEDYRIHDMLVQYEMDNKIHGALPAEDSHFASCILSNSEFNVKTEDAIDAVRIIEVIFKSLETGMPEEIHR